MAVQDLPLPSSRIWIWIIGVTLLLTPGILQASMHEQLLMDARSMALGNAVTADPPGIMSMHYNPAGLSNMDKGFQVSNSFGVLSIQASSKFLYNPDYADFLPGEYKDPLANTEGDVTGLVIYVPGYGDSVTLPATVLLPTNAGISYRAPNSRWTFATGLYSPLIGGFAREGADNPFRYGTYDYYWQHMIFSPSVSFKATSSLSFGVSIGLGFSAMGIATDVRLPNSMVALTDILGEATKGLAIPPFTDLTLPPPWFGGGLHPYESPASMDIGGVDNFAPSFNLGVLWEPYEWFSLGLVYHSEIKQEITGKYKMSYSKNFQDMISWLGSSPFLQVVSAILDLPTTPVAAQTGTFTTEMIIPRTIQAGIKVKPFDFLSILMDINWAQWSVRTEDRIVFDQKIQALRVAKLMGYTYGDNNFVLRRDLEDTFNYSIGLEIFPTNRLALRLGYQKRFTSVPKKYIDTIWNFPDWNVYSAGAGIKLGSGMTVDISAAWVKSDTLKVGVNESNHLNNTSFTSPIYNPYAGLDYEQDYDIYLFGLTISMPLSVMSHMTGELIEKAEKIFSILKPF
ncbi:MAG: outer membrane protein transport protein [Desulfobacula sp.]|nr:outer membrane protein transport protein [Desulfobacula sp.]